METSLDVVAGREDGRRVTGAEERAAAAATATTAGAGVRLTITITDSGKGKCTWTALEEPDPWRDMGEFHDL